MEHVKEKTSVPNGQVKPEDVIQSFVKNTSCSRGWLKFVVQMVFAALTVSSFIMIMLSVLRGSGPNNTTPADSSEQRCVVASKCRVTCSNIVLPSHDELIYEALNNTGDSCNETGISLFFHRPIFSKETLPLNWLSNVKSKVIELVITSGNLETIPPDAFMTNFAQNIQTLTLEDLNLSVLESNMLVGLSNLLEFNIRDCRIDSIERNALRTVDETLKRLQVKSSGTFDPVNLTGSSELQSLTHVDLTFNKFGNILNRHSFEELHFCKHLNLGSSGITSIGHGTFDKLINIEEIYLNNNCLKSIHPGLFTRLISMSGKKSPKIDLQHNYWHCDCQLQFLKGLQTDGFLLGDPVCYSPPHLRGRPFSSIPSFCRENTYTSVNTSDMSTVGGDRCIEVDDLYEKTRSTVFMRGFCNNTDSNKLIPYKCPRQTFEYLDMTELIRIRDSARFSNKLLSSVFFIHSQSTSIMEIQTSMVPGHDLIWFSTDLKDVYCVNALPKFLRLYNINEDAVYIFCPIEQVSRIIATNYCISYNPQDFDNRDPKDDGLSKVTRGYIRFIIYIALLVLSLITGASLVYITVLKYPTLLKASKRVLVVKHKNVDALVLPPEVNFRNEDAKTPPKCVEHIDYSLEKGSFPFFMRNASARSSKSNAPSYVSAAQPTQAQLAEWRLRYHFNKSAPGTSDVDIDLNTISWIYGNEPVYHSITAYEDLEKLQVDKEKKSHLTQAN